MSENEIRGLCLKSREIFLSQPILLELEAPLKICGKFSIFSKKDEKKLSEQRRKKKEKSSVMVVVWSRVEIES